MCFWLSRMYSRANLSEIIFNKLFNKENIEKFNGRFA